MRRTMFGKSPELERLAPPRASISEALLFDVSDQQASADLTLAERRVESWTFAPWLLLAGHLIITGCLVVETWWSQPHGSLFSVLAPLLGSLMSRPCRQDWCSSAGGGFRWRRIRSVD